MKNKSLQNNGMVLFRPGHTDLLRPCSVEVANKALIDGRFHKWVDKCEIVPPSIMVGGHHGGELKYCVGLVELEDGKIIEVSPTTITFTDKEVDI